MEQSTNNLISSPLMLPLLRQKHGMHLGLWAGLLLGVISAQQGAPGHLPHHMTCFARLLCLCSSYLLYWFTNNCFRGPDNLRLGVRGLFSHNLPPRPNFCYPFDAYSQPQM